MFAGIDFAFVRHGLARFDDTGEPIGKPLLITEVRTVLRSCCKRSALRAPDRPGGDRHYSKNLFATLAEASHDVVLLKPLVTRRFQDSSLECTKTGLSRV